MGRIARRQARTSMCGQFCVFPHVRPRTLPPNGNPAQHIRPARPCMWPPLRFSPCRCEVSVGEQVAQVKVVGHLEQCQHVLHVRPGLALSPTPHRVRIGPDPAGNLRPRQIRLLPEAPQPLREVVGEVAGNSGVLSANSRHCRRPSMKLSSRYDGASGHLQVSGRKVACSVCNCLCRSFRKARPLLAVCIPGVGDGAVVGCVPASVTLAQARHCADVQRGSRVGRSAALGRVMEDPAPPCMRGSD